MYRDLHSKEKLGGETASGGGMPDWMQRELIWLALKPFKGGGRRKETVLLPPQYSAFQERLRASAKFLPLQIGYSMPMQKPKPYFFLQGDDFTPTTNFVDYDHRMRRWAMEANNERRAERRREEIATRGTLRGFFTLGAPKAAAAAAASGVGGGGDGGDAGMDGVALGAEAPADVDAEGLYAQQLTERDEGDAIIDVDAQCEALKGDEERKAEQAAEQEAAKRRRVDEEQKREQAEQERKDAEEEAEKKRKDVQRALQHTQDIAQTRVTGDEAKWVAAVLYYRKLDARELDTETSGKGKNSATREAYAVLRTLRKLSNTAVADPLFKGLRWSHLTDVMDACAAKRWPPPHRELLHFETYETAAERQQAWSEEETPRKPKKQRHSFWTRTGVRTAHRQAKSYTAARHHNAWVRNALETAADAQQMAPHAFIRQVHELHAASPGAQAPADGHYDLQGDGAMKCVKFWRALAADTLRETMEGYDEDVAAIALVHDGAHKKKLPEVAYDITKLGMSRWRIWGTPFTLKSEMVKLVDAEEMPFGHLMKLVK
eukprot:gene44070-50243_t